MGRRITPQTHLRKYADLAHLPPEEYRKQKTQRDFEALQAAGKGVWQRPDKARERNLQRRYGLTAKQYDEIWAAQGSACALCCTTKGRFVVDHCHHTGRVRGILCHGCNTALGKFADSPEMLLLAVEYLTKGS